LRASVCGDLPQLARAVNTVGRKDRVGFRKIACARRCWRNDATETVSDNQFRCFGGPAPKQFGGCPGAPRSTTCACCRRLIPRRPSWLWPRQHRTTNVGDRSGMEVEGRKGRWRLPCRLGRGAGFASSDGDSPVQGCGVQAGAAAATPAQDARDQITEVRGVRVVELGGGRGE
jgi:hypothetical protein